MDISDLLIAGAIAFGLYELFLAPKPAAQPAPALPPAAPGATVPTVSPSGSPASVLGGATEGAGNVVPSWTLQPPGVAPAAPPIVYGYADGAAPPPLLP